MQIFKRLFGGRQKQGCIGSPKLEERIMELSNIIPASAWNKQMGMIETITATVKEGKRLVSNREFDDDLKLIKNGNGTTCFRTGTLVVFAEGGRAFKDKIEYVGGVFGSDTIVVRIPEKYRGKTGCLVAIHPYFSIEGNGSHNIVVDESHLHLLSRFAVKEGAFSREDVFGLPVEDPGNGREKITHHMKPCDYIGLAVRSTKHPKTVYTSELPEFTDSSFRNLVALVKPIITQENYIEHVAEAMKNGMSDRLDKLVREWVSEDRELLIGLNDAGIRMRS